MKKKLESRSPFNETFFYKLDAAEEETKIRKFADSGRKVVAVQGLGFVGSAMVAALGNVQKNSRPVYSVLGVELGDSENYWKIARVNRGTAPVLAADKQLTNAYDKGLKNGNVLATWSHFAYSVADIVVVDINLDVHKKELGNAADYDFTLESYIRSIQIIASHIRENTLVIIESTIPPGTTEKIIYSLFKKSFSERELDIDKFKLVHSYERVMPGVHYLSSITDYYRVFAGIDQKSVKCAKAFFKSFINTKKFPLTELHSTTASELSKVLENSYRAMNIAFIQEWTQLAARADVDLFQVIQAIRMRKTHQNIMSPGFGVGGYCLTKDALLADWAAENFYESPDLLNMSVNAVDINDLMPGYSFRIIKKYFTELKGKKIIIFGISYLNDVADTRHSPSAYFYELCIDADMEVEVHDPMFQHWAEKDIPVLNGFEQIATHDYDIAIFTVRHREYLDMSGTTIAAILPHVKLIIDANNIIDDRKAEFLFKHGIHLFGSGKGHWNKYENG